MMSVFRSKKTQLDPRLDCRFIKIGILSAELDEVRSSSLERTKGNVTKASFVGVTAGLVLSASSTRLVEFGGITPLISSVLALLCLVFVIQTVKPRRIDVPTGDRIVQQLLYDDPSLTPLSVAEKILAIKRRESKMRDARNKTDVSHLKVSFWLLLGSVLFTVTSYMVGNMIGIDITLEWK